MKMKKQADNSKEISTENKTQASRKCKKRCRACPHLTFKSRPEYLLHIRDHHDGKEVGSFMCSDCGKQLNTKSELKHHIDSKCGTIKLFKCNECGQELMTAGSLHNHMLRHTGIRKFMCRFCAKLFLTGGQLKVHERIHTYEKAFICEVCGKGFCHRQSLITHSTLHTGIKPFQCENCGSSFSCVGNLLKHRRTHPDTCGLIPLTTHRVQNPTTKLKVKINTPANTRLKAVEKEKQLQKMFEEVGIEQTNGQIESYVVQTKNVGAEVAPTQVFLVPEKESELLEKPIELHDPLALDDVNITQSENVDTIYASLEETKQTSSTNLNSGCLLEDDNKAEVMNDTSSEETEKKIISNTATEPEKSLPEAGTLSCRICHQTYINSTYLLEHEKMHPEQGPIRKMPEKSKRYKCCCCKTSFETKAKCFRHQQTNHADMLTCFECDKIYSSLDSLHTHQRMVHRGNRRKIYSYICNKCGKEFKQKSLMKHHEENNCGTGPLFQCQVCQKYFATINSKRSHMKVHDPEKKLLCKYCGKSFHWMGQLKIHERRHTGEKPFTCLYCPKAFAYRESLLTHSSLHTGIKPHLCEACGSRFSCIGNLLKHRVTHASTCGVWYEKTKSS